MAAGDILWKAGSEVVLEASGASISSGGYSEALDDDLRPADVGNMPLGEFELDVAFSAAPSAGAKIVVIEQKINLGVITYESPIRED